MRGCDKMDGKNNSKIAKVIKEWWKEYKERWLMISKELRKRYLSISLHYGKRKWHIYGFMLNNI